MTLFQQLAIKTIQECARWRCYYDITKKRLPANSYAYFAYVQDDFWTDQIVQDIYKHSPTLRQYLAERLRDSHVFFNNTIPCIYAYSLSVAIVNKWAKSAYPNFSTFVNRFPNLFSEKNFYSLYDNWSLQQIQTHTIGQKLHTRVEIVHHFLRKMNNTQRMKQHIKVETTMPPLNLF